MSQRYSSRMRRGRWTRGGSSKKDAPMSGAGYDIEKVQTEEEERWKKLEHAVALAVNYFQMRPVNNEYAVDITGIIAERARSNFRRATGLNDDYDYSITMILRAIPRSNIDACVLPPQMKMPTFSNTNTFVSDDMFGPQEEEVEDAATTAAAAEAELNTMNGIIPYNFGPTGGTDDGGAAGGAAGRTEDTSYEEMMAQIFLFNGSPISNDDFNAASGGGSNSV